MSDLNGDFGDMQKLWIGTFVKVSVLDVLLAGEPNRLAQEWASNIIGPGPVFRVSDVPVKALELLGVSDGT